MLTLILKGTNGCNLNCTYCSLGEKTRHDTVTQDMLCNIIGYVCRVCQYRNDTRINVILHGGEPTLVSADIYENAIKWAKEYFPNITIDISLQTNAFHISERYFEFLLSNHVNVGISLDGSASIHNKVRKDRNGHDTFDTVIFNIDRMLETGLNVSCLMVLTSLGILESLSYLDFFASRNLHLKINPLLNYGVAYNNPELVLQKGDYANYLIKVYEHIVSNGMNVSISPIDKIIKAIMSKERIKECTFNPECNRNFLCIDHVGDIYPCGKYSDIHSFKIGNVLTQDVDLLSTSEMNELVNRRTCSIPAKCLECKYFFLCNAGCSAEASIEKAFEEPPLLCDDYKILFDYFSGTGLHLLKKQLVERKMQLMEKKTHGI